MWGGGLGPLIPGRIPWRDVTRWCDRKGGDPDELDVIVRAMDAAYLEWHAAALAKNAES